MALGARLPVHILTGFLGSGKSTLLKQILQSDQYANSMLIVNEIGEIGIDHALLEQSDDETLLLDNGCMCCVLRGDLQELLVSLAMKRARGTIPSFDRLFIETSGLADPTPIIHTLYSDQAISHEYELASVTTLLDPLHLENLSVDPYVSEAQLACGDVIVISKTDAATPDTIARAEALARRINPGAVMLRSFFGSVANEVISDRHRIIDRQLGEIGGAGGQPHQHDAPGHVRHAHVYTTTLRMHERVNKRVFEAFLKCLLDLQRDNVVRIKGVMCFADEPGQKLVQGVGHTLDKLEDVEMSSLASDESALVLIFREDIGEQVRALWAQLERLGVSQAVQP